MQNINNHIDEVKNAFIGSPIRNCLLSDKNIPFKKVIQHNLDDVMDNFDIILEKPDKPIKVVIMGEVKSGKSTLLNAIIGKEISEVDVLEATSSIINIYYSEDEYTFKSDNSVLNIGTNVEYLKKINIVDTPGLRSITMDNESKSLNYIQNSDLILFVFDSTHIGQQDIKESLDYICSYGKPVVGILNKADLLEDKDKVLDYAEDEYGVYIDKYFVISSYLEYQDIVSKNAIAGTQDIIIGGYNDLRDNFNDLRLYIKDICENQQILKDDSISSSLKSIIHKERVYHYEYLKSIEMIELEISNHKNLLQNKLEYIQSKMDFEINDWIENIFLVEEINRINRAVDIATNYINESYINTVINEKKVEFDELFLSEWNECIKEVNEVTNKDIKNMVNSSVYKRDYIELPNINISNEDININEMLATIGAGAILGATSGSAIAMYAAGIGVSSSTVTMGTAMMTYCPPLLIAGTLTGGIGKIIYDKIILDQKNKDILKDINLFKENIKIDINLMLNEIYDNASKDIIKTNQEIFESSRDISLNEYEINDLKENIKLYIEKLQNI